MSNIDKQALRGLSVEAPFYLAECCNCGEVMPSSKLIESRNYMDGDADCYCPHCNADDCDIADMGSAASESWNYQQKRIEALLDELEAKDKAWSAQDDHINQQADRIESLEKKNGELGRALGAAEKRIAELEAREVKLPELKMLSDYLREVTMREREDILLGVKLEFYRELQAAGIRINGEG